MTHASVGIIIIPDNMADMGKIVIIKKRPLKMSDPMPNALVVFSCMFYLHRLLIVVYIYFNYFMFLLYITYDYLTH